MVRPKEVSASLMGQGRESLRWSEAARKRRTKETDSEAREVEICRSLTEDSTSKTASGKVSKQ